MVGTMKRVVFAAALIGLAGFARPAQKAQAEPEKQWRWVVWIAEPCVYPCDPVTAGCGTNPDCGCDCYR